MNSQEKNTQENLHETPSQIIKNILTILEAFSLPKSAVDIIRKKHWHLHDAIEKEIKNGKTLHRY